MSNDFTICLGQSGQIAYHDEHEETGFRVTLAETGAETMTGGRIKRIEKYVSDEIFMATYGDGVADVNLRELLSFHQRHGKLATLTTVRPFSRYGILDVEQDQGVSGFVEKPQLDGWINAGFFVFHRRVFDYLGDDDCVLEKEPLQRLAREGQLMSFPHEGFFYAMDTYREYQYLNELWADGKAPWCVWGRGPE
jgi:glucose-1-phosphate cytidylyltransferase